VTTIAATTRTPLTTLALLLALTAAAAAQHGDPRHGSHGAPAHAAARPPGGHDAEACEQEFEQVVADGRGFGMAFVADRRGYPGPLHVLELEQALALRPEQTARVRTLMDGMFRASRPLGAALLAAERRLGEVFATGRPDEAAVRRAVVEVEGLRAELRTLHLTTHLATRDVLTEEQLRRYHALRWDGQR
jgi:Spy/CpxP family protein refolding chaperone